MTTTHPKLKWLAVLVAIMLAQAVGAAGTDEQHPVSLKLGAGVEYDSNVAVLELDRTSGESDVAALLDFGIGYSAAPTGKLDLSMGYDFSQTLHEEFSAFDVRIHRGSANVSYDAGRADVGANFQYAHAELDGSEFLVLRQVSPFVTRLIGKRLFLRFAYLQTDKAYDGNRQRDAQADSLSSDVYVFLNGVNTYLAFGYRYNDEDALDGQFDYTGHQLKAQLTKRLKLGAKTVTLKSYLRSESRDYEGPTLAIGRPRRDDRYQFETTAEVPLTKRIAAEVGYKYADNRSNLPSLDFGEHVLSIGFTAGL